MRDHSEGPNPERVPIDPPPDLERILRRLALGDERRRNRGYVAKRGTADPKRKERRKVAKLTRRRNRR